MDSIVSKDNIISSRLTRDLLYFFQLRFMKSHKIFWSKSWLIELIGWTSYVGKHSINSLKIITKKHDALIDFFWIRWIIQTNKQTNKQTNDHQFTQALDIIHEIKEIILEINKKFNEKALKQEFQRTNEYVQKYLEQLNRLIENAKKQGVSNEIIKRLESARENLSSTDDPRQIKEIRKIMSLKDQFDPIKYDRLESRILQVGKTLSRLFQIDEVYVDDIFNARDIFQNIKQNLSDDEFETVNELLRDLVKQLIEIKNAFW